MKIEVRRKLKEIEDEDEAGFFVYLVSLVLCISVVPMPHFDPRAERVLPSLWTRLERSTFSQQSLQHTELLDEVPEHYTVDMNSK